MTHTHTHTRDKPTSVQAPCTKRTRHSWRIHLRVAAEGKLGQRAGFGQVDEEEEERERFAGGSERNHIVSKGFGEP